MHAYTHSNDLRVDVNLTLEDVKYSEEEEAAAEDTHTHLRIHERELAIGNRGDRLGVRVCLKTHPKWWRNIKEKPR